ncbi:unnamed protein product [Polarella glacialis]|uniref:Uncharacterized protein n=1 Tax=Polarella glacialis TaxID=89957 RepID=A0A813LZJ0_POLGL|nr:unnamed protein product [Polarella glacialis]
MSRTNGADYNGDDCPAFSLCSRQMQRTHRRGKRKRDEMGEAIAAMRRKA